MSDYEQLSNVKKLAETAMGADFGENHICQERADVGHPTLGGERPPLMSKHDVA
jgi:hypothetical protein